MEKWLAALGYLEKFWSWKFLGPCFVFSSIINFICLFPAFYDRLKAMKIANWVMIFWLFCLACVVCKVWAWGGEQIKRKTEQHKRQEAIKNLLLSLLPDEVALLRYILARPVCVTWLPYAHSAVLSLYHKKCLL